MNRTSTAYNRVAEVLRMEILAGVPEAGRQLPTEQALCRRFATSRITIRRALQILEEEWLVRRRQGSGTYVSPAPMRKIPLLNIGFFNSVTRHAPDLGRRLLQWRWKTLDADQAAMLQTLPGERVLYARRVDLLTGVPVAMDDVYLPGRFADRLNQAAMAELDFLAVWQQRQGITLSHCRQTLEAIAADALAAKTLGLKRGVPLLKETDMVYLNSGSAAGIFLSRYRADYFQFASTVRLSPTGMKDRP